MSRPPWTERSACSSPASPSGPSSTPAGASSRLVAVLTIALATASRPPRSRTNSGALRPQQIARTRGTRQPQRVASTRPGRSMPDSRVRQRWAGSSAWASVRVPVVTIAPGSIRSPRRPSSTHEVAQREQRVVEHQPGRAPGNAVARHAPASTRPKRALANRKRSIWRASGRRSGRRAATARRSPAPRRSSSPDTDTERSRCRARSSRSRRTPRSDPSLAGLRARPEHDLGLEARLAKRATSTRPRCLRAGSAWCRRPAPRSGGARRRVARSSGW